MLEHITGPFTADKMYIYNHTCVRSTIIKILFTSKQVTIFPIHLMKCNGYVAPHYNYIKQCFDKYGLKNANFIVEKSHYSKTEAELDIWANNIYKELFENALRISLFMALTSDNNAYKKAVQNFKCNQSLLEKN